MRRRNFNVKAYRKRLGTQVIFISVLTIASFIRIFFEEEYNDFNVAAFGTVLAFGAILGLSIYNGMMINFFESLNDKLRILNYCLPIVPLALCFLIFNIPVLTLDILVFLTLTLVSNLAGYYFIERTKEKTASR